MRHLILILLIVGQLSCTKKKLTEDTIDNTEIAPKINEQTDILDQQETTIIIDTLTEIEFKGLFKEKQRNKYDLHNDTSLKTKIEKSYNFWTGKKLIINDTLKPIAVYGYPLSFKKAKNQIRWVTTLSEGESGNLIRLSTLDKYYNMIDNAVISSYGGDAGTNSWALGKFKNDSTYAMKTFVTGYDTDSVENIINSCLIIHSNGKIERQENCR